MPMVTQKLGDRSARSRGFLGPEALPVAFTEGTMLELSPRVIPEYYNSRNNALNYLKTYVIKDPPHSLPFFKLLSSHSNEL